MQEVCLIIPCYNEENRLNRSVILDFLCSNPSVSFCFVNDGSRDRTLSKLKELQAERSGNIIVIDKPVNEGKAEAVRSGILEITGRKQYSIIGFWDADFSTPLSELNAMLESMSKDQGLIAVFGSRIKRMGSFIERKTVRHIFGRVFSTFSNWILKVPFYDSQCGAKIFRAEAAGVAFEKKFITRWLFDVEILARIRNFYGIQKTSEIVLEQPLLRWKDIKGSKLKLMDYFNVPLDLIRIHLHYN